MGQDGPRSEPSAVLLSNKAAVAQAVKRARIYLDAASPTSAHELLDPIVRNHWDQLLDTGARVELLSFYLQACLDLRKTESLDLWIEPFVELVTNEDGLTPDVWIRGVSVLASLFCLKGEYKAALQICRKVPRETIQRATPRMVIALLFREVETLFRIGDLDTAETKAVDCVALAERETDLALKGHCYGTLAMIFRLRGRLHESIKLYSRAAHLHREAGDFLGLARDLLNRAWVLNRLGHLDQSHRSFRDAHRQAKQIGHATLILRSNLGLGMLDIRRREWRKARQLLLGSWRQARRLDMPREACLSLEFLGEALTLSGKGATATRALNLCRLNAERIAPDGDLVVECDIRRALLAIERGRWSEAVQLATKAAEEAKRACLPWEEAQAQSLLSFALHERGGETQANEAAARAEMLNREMGCEAQGDLARDWLKVIARRSESKPASRKRRVAARSSRQADVWTQVGLLTQSSCMLAALEEARHLAESDAHILIIGETGTGKELIARGIHELSGRAGPFVPFNCAACPEDLIESELFGAVRGAYTGASHARSGLIAEADGGTLLLDEVGDLSSRAQGALLRFLDTGELRALGSNSVGSVTVGVIAAAQPSFFEKLDAGLFRKDLYYRLAQGNLRVPPLRDRQNDTLLLLDHFWQVLSAGDPFPWRLLTPGARQLIEAHPWEGNVRELHHFVRTLHLRDSSRGAGRIDSDSIRELLSPPSSRGVSNRSLHRPTLEQVERVLEQTGGNVSKAASLLGISRQKIYRIRRGTRK